MRQLNDDTFIGQIRFPDLQKRYKEESKAIIRQTEREFKRDSEKLKETNETEIHTCREHDELVNLCIHPFTESSSPIRQLGYRFIRADPLSELGEKNVDFLLYNSEGRRPIIIFGEVKTVITNTSKLLRDLEEHHEIIRSKIEYIKNEYLKTDLEPIIEFVLGVPSSFSIEARDAVWDNQRDIIVWLTTPDLKLKLAQPRQENGRLRMLHHDHNLNEILRQTIPSSKKAFDCFPQSHTVIKFKLLIECIEYPTHGPVINKGNLSDKIRSQMSYLDENQQKIQRDLILKEAVNIGFIKPSQDSQTRYNVVSKSRKPSTLERELTNSWINSHLSDAKNKEINTSINRLQTDILNLQNKKPTLFKNTG